MHWDFLWNPDGDQWQWKTQRRKQQSRVNPHKRRTAKRWFSNCSRDETKAISRDGQSSLDEPARPADRRRKYSTKVVEKRKQNLTSYRPSNREQNTRTNQQTVRSGLQDGRKFSNWMQTAAGNSSWYRGVRSWQQRVLRSSIMNPKYAKYRTPLTFRANFEENLRKWSPNAENPGCLVSYLSLSAKSLNISINNSFIPDTHLLNVWQ